MYCSRVRKAHKARATRRNQERHQHNVGMATLAEQLRQVKLVKDGEKELNELRSKVVVVDARLNKRRYEIRQADGSFKHILKAELANLLLDNVIEALQLNPFIWVTPEALRMSYTLNRGHNSEVDNQLFYGVRYIQESITGSGPGFDLDSEFDRRFICHHFIGARETNLAKTLREEAQRQAA